MSLTPDQLAALIAQDPALVALARATPPDTAGIAVALSAGRTEVRSRLVTARTVIRELGPAGGAALWKLRAFGESASTLADNPQAFGLAANVWWGMQFPVAEGIDVGDAQARALLDACAEAGVITAVERDALKSLAVQPAPISEWDVRCAILNDDGSLRV